MMWGPKLILNAIATVYYFSTCKYAKFKRELCIILLILLNLTPAGLSVHTWFLEITFVWEVGEFISVGVRVCVRVCVCVCVCVCVRMCVFCVSFLKAINSS